MVVGQQYLGQNGRSSFNGRVIDTVVTLSLVISISDPEASSTRSRNDQGDPDASFSPIDPGLVISRTRFSSSHLRQTDTDGAAA
jgi:hypothetical protein